MFHIRRYFSTGLIALLSLVAAMAIYVLVTGEIGWGEIKALLTALIGFAVGLNAVTCLTCRHEVQHVWYVWVGVTLGILSGLMLIALLWFDIPLPHYWQISSVTLTPARPCWPGSRISRPMTAMPPASSRPRPSPSRAGALHRKAVCAPPNSASPRNRFG